MNNTELLSRMRQLVPNAAGLVRSPKLFLMTMCAPGKERPSTVVFANPRPTGCEAFSPDEALQVLAKETLICNPVYVELDSSTMDYAMDEHDFDILPVLEFSGDKVRYQPEGSRSISLSYLKGDVHFTVTKAPQGSLDDDKWTLQYNARVCRDLLDKNMAAAEKELQELQERIKNMKEFRLILDRPVFNA